MSFRFAVNSNGLRPLALADTVAMAGRLGLDGIEWGLPAWDEAGEAIAEMAQRTRDAGLAVAGWINGPKLWKTDDLRRWAELAARHGGGSLRVAHPWIAWDYGESLHQRDPWQVIFALARDALPAAQAIARETGIRFLLELHAGALTSSALAAARLLEGADPALIGVIYDPANTAIEGGMRPRSEVEILGPLLAYVHAKNAVWVPAAQGREHPVRRASWQSQVCALPGGLVDWVEVCFALKSAGFAGWISCEEFFCGGEAESRLHDGLEFLRQCASLAPDRPRTPFTAFND